MSKELLRRKMTVTEIRILFSSIPQFKYEMWGNTSHSVPGQQVYLGSDDFHYDSPHEALSAGIKHVVDFPDSFQFNHEQVPFLFQVDDTVEEFGVAHMVSKKQNMQEIRRELGDTDEIDEYDGGDIWIERLEAPTVTEFPGVRGTLLTDQTHAASGIRTNVQRLEYKHSPTGFNFGYGGSGPADLALNICLMFCNQGRDAYRIYQEFKRTFLCVGQMDRLEIRRGEIENFLLIQGAEQNPNI